MLFLWMAIITTYSWLNTRIKSYNFSTIDWRILGLNKLYICPELNVQSVFVRIILNYFASIKKSNIKLLKYFIFSLYSTDKIIYILHKGIFIYYTKGRSMYVYMYMHVYTHAYTGIYVYSEFIGEESSKMI